MIFPNETHGSDGRRMAPLRLKQKERLSQIMTRWSILRALRQSLSDASPSATTSDDPAARAAYVCEYAKGIRCYAAKIARDDDVADDVSQEVISRLLSGDVLPKKLERGPGRFRDFLKMVIRHAVYAALRRKRPTVPLDQVALACDGPPLESDVVLLLTWRRAILDSALEGLRRYQDAQPSNHFHRIVLLAIDHPDETTDMLAARLREQTGQSVSPNAFRKQQERARRKFANFLVSEVARGLKRPGPGMLEAALIDLRLYEYVRRFLLDERNAGPVQIDESMPASASAEERMLRDPVREVSDARIT
jgi:DNA-directed RNA polymerase specialized sigma24 family protein